MPGSTVRAARAADRDRASEKHTVIPSLVRVRTGRSRTDGIGSQDGPSAKNDIILGRGHAGMSLQLDEQGSGLTRAIYLGEAGCFHLSVSIRHQDLDVEG